MQVNVTKIVLYVFLTVFAIHSGRQFVGRYSRLMDTQVDEDPLALIDSNPTPALPPVKPGDTNIVAATNGDGEEPPADQPQTKPAGDTNAVAAATVAPAKPETEAPAPEMLTKRDLDRNRAVDTSGIALYAFALFGTLIGLGVMAAHDISTFVGQKTHKLLHNEEGEGIHSMDYDQAEEAWANGEHLEALRLMREYLTKNPREVHVMARIAEIYEKDLGNFLAAVLEYEEYLKQKLPAERWAWAAVHLVNLYYGKLDKPAQGLALLWRVHREYGQTQAAVKARKRLLQIDPAFASEQAKLDREAEAAEAARDEAAAASANEPAAAEQEVETEDADEPIWEPPAAEVDTNLPKGFRPKKR